MDLKLSAHPDSPTISFYILFYCLLCEPFPVKKKRNNVLTHADFHKLQRALCDEHLIILHNWFLVLQVRPLCAWKGSGKLQTKHNNCEGQLFIAAKNQKKDYFEFFLELF